MRINRQTFRALLTAAIIVLALTFPSTNAQPTNSGFETGDLSEWSIQGSVEVLQSSEFTPAITPPEGQYFVLLRALSTQTTKRTLLFCFLQDNAWKTL
jgi:hypothetical protein